MGIQNSQRLECTFLDADGNETINEFDAVAKMEYSDITKRQYYSIRQNSSGTERGCLVDVRLVKTGFGIKNIERGSDFYPFVRVSQVSFQEYGVFLQNKNGTRLTLAERLRHG